MVSEQVKDDEEEMGCQKIRQATVPTPRSVKESGEKVSSIGTFTPIRNYPDGRDVHFVYVVDDGEEIAVCNSRADLPEDGKDAQPGGDPGDGGNGGFLTSSFPVALELFQPLPEPKVYRQAINAAERVVNQGRELPILRFSYEVSHLVGKWPPTPSKAAHHKTAKTGSPRREFLGKMEASKLAQRKPKHGFSPLHSKPWSALLMTPTSWEI